MAKSQNTKKATLYRILLADEALFQQDKSRERKEDHISLKQGNTKCSDLFQDAIMKALDASILYYQQRFLIQMILGGHDHGPCLHHCLHLILDFSVEGLLVVLHSVLFVQVVCLLNARFWVVWPLPDEPVAVSPLIVCLSN